MVSCAAVDADPQHEVLVVELLAAPAPRSGRRRCRACAGCRGPTSASGRAGRPGRCESKPALGVDVLDPGADVEPVVVLLDLLVGVERLAVAERPLALAALALGRLGWVGRGGHVVGSLWPALRIAPCHRWAVRRRRSGGQLKVRAGGSSRPSRQTTTGTNALEVDMPPRHQRDSGGKTAGGGHGGQSCHRTRDTCPNRARFALTVSTTVAIWDTGSWESDHRRGYPDRRAAVARPPVRHLRPRAVLRDALRLLRLQHLHALASWRVRRLPGRLARRGAPGAGAGRAPLVGPRPVDTVFVGGGTPSLLGGARLGGGARRRPVDASGWPRAPRSPPRPTRSRPRRSSSRGLREAGFTRVSLGMQSAAPHVLAVLDRRAHAGPGRSRRRGRRARPGSSTSTST